jgi:hypothetical protein
MGAMIALLLGVDGPYIAKYSYLERVQLGTPEELDFCRPRAVYKSQVESRVIHMTCHEMSRPWIRF